MKPSPSISMKNQANAIKPLPNKGRAAAGSSTEKQGRARR